MRFLVAYKKGNKCLLKIALQSDKEVWATTSEAVFNYAKNNFKEGEECGFDYTDKNGQYFVSRVNKDGKSTEKLEEPEATKVDDGKKYCSCGKEIKNHKYDKCYACNQKNSSKSYSGKSSYKKSPETEEQIKRLSVLRACGDAILVLQGQVSDVEALGDIIEVLYQKMYKVVSD